MNLLISIVVFSVVGFCRTEPITNELSDKEIQRVNRAQHNLDLEVAEFQRNLEGLKTTVEFPAINI